MWFGIGIDAMILDNGLLQYAVSFLYCSRSLADTSKYILDLAYVIQCHWALLYCELSLITEYHESLITLGGKLVVTTVLTMQMQFLLVTQKYGLLAIEGFLDI